LYEINSFTDWLTPFLLQVCAQCAKLTERR